MPRLPFAFAVLLLLALPLVGCGGGDATIEVDPNATPATALQIHARSIRFDRKALVGSAGVPVTVTLVNEDAGVLHNFAVYSKKGGDNLFRGETFQGKKSVDNVVPALPAGTYYFRCDVHPDMNGVYVTK